MYDLKKMVGKYKCTGSPSLLMLCACIYIYLNDLKQVCFINGRVKIQCYVYVNKVCQSACITQNDKW